MDYKKKAITERNILDALNGDNMLILNKAYTEGIYSDTPANRKLGRVGMSYADYAIKMQKQKEAENKGKENSNTTENQQKEDGTFKLKRVELYKSPKSHDRLDKEIKESRTGRNREDFESMNYLFSIHSNNPGTYGFLSSVNDLLTENGLHEDFGVEGQYGMYRIVRKDTGKMLLEIAASVNGQQIFFREPDEHYPHKVGVHSSTVKNYFNKLQNEIEKIAPEVKKAVDKKNEDTMTIKTAFDKEVIDNPWSKGEKLYIWKDKETGIPVYRTYHETTEITDVLNSVDKLKKIQQNLLDLKAFYIKHGRKLEYNAFSQMNRYSGSANQYYPLGSIQLKSGTKSVYYSPSSGSIKTIINGKIQNDSKSADLKNPKSNYDLGQIVKLYEQREKENK